MVFQHFALLPWADVLTNVAFGLELRGLGRAEREHVAAELIRAVGLAGFERHLPWQLSGGMQQRVGLARAFVTHSMDEAVRLGDRVVLLTPRPGRIQEVIDVPLPRPRPPDLERHPTFIDLKEYLWWQLRTMRA